MFQTIKNLFKHFHIAVTQLTLSPYGNVGYILQGMTAYLVERWTGRLQVQIQDWKVYFKLFS